MLKEKTLFDVIWIAGNKQNGPDYMSRFNQERGQIGLFDGICSTLSNQEQDNVYVNDINIVDSIVSSFSENEIKGTFKGFQSP